MIKSNRIDDQQMGEYLAIFENIAKHFELLSFRS